MDDIKFLIALHSLPGMGSRRLKILIDYFQNHGYAWQRDDIWPQVPGFNGAMAEMALAARRSADADRIYDNFLRSGASLVTLADPDYPALLQSIYDPPYLLFYRGKLPAAGDLCIAMVGSRQATPYGQHVAAALAGELADEGAWVVSGLARGIDTCSHRGCLGAGGKTAAILGCGLDLYYPRENRGLYDQISASGAVISEFPLGTPPLPLHFPARNRIISGLSRGVVVVEAALKSGSLITADFALEQGRDVFAVPGPVTSAMSGGTHRLIKQGAKLAESGRDILEEYLPQPGQAKGEVDLFSYTREEREVLELIAAGAAHFDYLAVRSGMETGRLAGLLTVWEIQGLIKSLPGRQYIYLG